MNFSRPTSDTLSVACGATFPVGEGFWMSYVGNPSNCLHPSNA